MRRLLRRLFHRCLSCGGPRNIHEKPIKDCLHCHAVKNWCHWCGKRWSFGQRYGMGPNELLKALAK